MWQNSLRLKKKKNFAPHCTGKKAHQLCEFPLRPSRLPFRENPLTHIVEFHMDVDKDKNDTISIGVLKLFPQYNKPSCLNSFSRQCR